jgi:predicted aldo/keto reductase-like oxidoreductase
MQKRILGKTGLEVSAVGFGGIPIMRLTDDEAVSVLRHALDLGVNFIDTAAGYGDSQTKIGKAIAGRRDGLVLATKSGAATKADMQADIDRARAEMQTDVIDLFQLHGVSMEGWQAVSGPDGALEALLEARDKGHVRHIGFTSHSVSTALTLADEDVFETVQFPFNLVTHEPADELIPKARANNLGFIVMKPMCGGQFDDAGLAFKFLNGYPDLVAIPGIETAEEIEEIVSIVDSGQTLAGDDAVRAQEIVERLGKVFCRRCGYCEPCPEGIPITTSVVFDGLARRFPSDLGLQIANRIIEKAPQCTECGQCVTQCPYDLPIPDLLKKAFSTAEEFVKDHS